MTSHRVVVAVDGSAMSDAAIRWATTEAAARQVPLRLVHAFVWPHFRVQLGGNDLAPGLRAFADKIVLDALDVAHKADPTVAVSCGRVDGFPSPVLIGESQSADLVVLGCRGLGSTLGFLVGSTSVDLAAHAHCPVVVIHPDPLRAGTHVVVGYDGSVSSAAALDFGLAHAHRDNLKMRVVTVRSAEHTASVTQEELAAAVRQRPGGDSAELVQASGHPAEQLLAWADDALLVVVGSRGRGGFKGLLLGSVSQAVLQHAHCPVAVIPPLAARGAR